LKEFVDLLHNTVLIVFKGNREFFKLIEEFHEKLPPKHKKAKKLLDSSSTFTIVDTTNMKMNLTDTEIDLFHKRLENFKYNRILFGRKKIEAFSNNLQRLLISSGWEKFGITMIQTVLEEEPFARNKPYLFGYRVGKLIGY
jgi:hypothetical protein